MADYYLGYMNESNYSKESSGQNASHVASLPGGEGHDLHRAIDQGEVGLVQALIQSGADLNRLSGNGESPLGIAMENARCMYEEDIHNGRMSRGQEMFERVRNNEGAFGLYDSRWPVEDETGETFQQKAVRICELLVHAGARDFTRLAAAAYSGDVELTRQLISEGMPVNFQVDCWGTPLIAAIAGEQLEVVRLLLSAGADPNFCFERHGYDGRVSPIETAIRTGKPELVEVLLAAGADPDLDPQGGDFGEIRRIQPDWCDAPYSGAGKVLSRNRIRDPRMADILFRDRDAVWTFRDEAGHTAAHLLDAGSLAACSAWIPEGVLERVSYCGWSPAVKALQLGDWDKVLGLLELGADVDSLSGVQSSGMFDSAPHLITTDLLGLKLMSPLHAALTYGNETMVRRLLKYGGRFDSPAYTVAEIVIPETIKKIRSDLRGFWPQCFPKDKGWRHWFYSNNNTSRRQSPLPGLSWNDGILFLHFMLEDLRRVSAYDGYFRPVSCREIAQRTGNDSLIEMVTRGARASSESE
jgi:ankyrin repeat protein